MTLVITGLTDNLKVPGGYAQVNFGQSRVQLSSIALRCQIVGLKATSGGTIAADLENKRILNKNDADTYLGAGGEAARMAYAALDECQGLSGFELWACCPAPAGGATAATCTITVTGTATDVGTIYVWIGKDMVEVTIANGDAQNSVATKIDSAIKAHTNYARFFAGSGVATNVVTETHRSAGIRGNQSVLYVDFSKAPGVTLALGGAGSAITTGSSTLLGRYFGGGAGTETLTNIFSLLFPVRNHFLAVAQNDATSLGLWKAQLDLKAAALEGRREHMVMATNGTFGAATSLSQSTVNNARVSHKWLEASESQPCEITAAVACLRAATEGTEPNSAYDDYPYRTIVPQRVQTFWVGSITAKQAALDVGVSPLISGTDGIVRECRAITTRCMNGSTPDYRTLDDADAYVPDYMADRILNVYSTEVKPAMKYVQPNPGPNEPELSAQVLSPDRWTPRVIREMQDAQKENILTQTGDDSASSEYNYVANRIMTAMNVIRMPHNHQVGISVNQLNVSAL